MCNLQLQFIVKLLKIANETGRVEFGVVISLSLSLSLSHVAAAINRPVTMGKVVMDV